MTLISYNFKKYINVLVLTVLMCVLVMKDTMEQIN